MVHHECNIVLRILGQIRALWNEAANEFMVPFCRTLLVWSVWIAIENPGSSDTVHRIEFNGHRVGKLAAVICQTQPEDVFKFHITQTLVEIIKNV